MKLISCGDGRTTAWLWRDIRFERVDSRVNCSSCDKRTTNRQGRGVLNKTEKTGAENIHSRVEVEGVPRARFSNPTA